MRFLKIMGIFTSILSLLSCGHGNKRVTQNDGINSNSRQWETTSQTQTEA